MKLPDRFWSKVNKDGPVPAHAPKLGKCWIWTAHLNNQGYGQFNLNGRLWLPHRLVYFAKHGAPKILGKDVDHLCRTPSCCNPRHLEAVTHAVNCQRGNAGGA